jgi:CelD/BcsL family acetyltransferase involved in cellulose biosynthesis
MNAYLLNPLADGRWTRFAENHPAASVFHSTAWIDALTRTYGYEPRVFTTSCDAVDLSSGIPVLAVRSWITGRRLVSLPFSDHCEPLVQRPEQVDVLLDALMEAQRVERWRYVELRPASSLLESRGSLGRAATFYLHSLDLRPGLEEIFRRFHKDSIQRKIRRGQREGLTTRRGNSKELIDAFYALLLRTRRRHLLPPQPRNWFANLASCFGDTLQTRLACKDGRAVAGILTLRHRSTIFYKYGASDERFHALGGMPFLFWDVIEEAKGRNAETLDLGRSELDNSGLITFKERLGAARYPLSYWRIGGAAAASTRSLPVKIAKHVLRCLPDPILAAAGKVFYRHVG